MYRYNSDSDEDVSDADLFVSIVWMMPHQTVAQVKKVWWLCVRVEQKGDPTREAVFAETQVEEFIFTLITWIKSVVLANLKSKSHIWPTEPLELQERSHSVSSPQ